MVATKIIDASSTSRTITQVKAIDASGTDRTITSIRVIDSAGTDRLVYSSGGGALAVSVTPTTVGGRTSGGGSATTGVTTAAASGGTGPYTYSWALTSYTNVVPPTITAPTAAATTFTQSNLGYNEIDTAVFTVTAKDSLGATATATVNATFRDREGSLGGGGTL